MLDIEQKWRAKWREANCFRAPDRPSGAKFFNFDSGPFPNGPLHMGHVRTYVLGDVTARYQRLLGKAVLYATEWDAFGLPNESEALRKGLSPPANTASCIRQMRQQLDQLGISYDWSRIHATCDGDYYRWTQRLFLLLFDSGLVYRRNAPTLWCRRCRSSVAHMQAGDGRCWRCQTPVVYRTSPQWFVAVSRYAGQLLEGIDALGQWSDTGKKLLRRSSTQSAESAVEVPDWHVSRQRVWGTPIPMIHCDHCGIVPDHRLPVRLPEELDWTLGADALNKCDTFVRTDCPRCGRTARRETGTLDCFFDDAWSYLSCVAQFDESENGAFPTRQIRPWTPVDRFHSGFDTFSYLNLYRFVGHVLFDRGLLDCPEPIASYKGHDMVLCEGRKMSKHLGNAVSPDAVMAQYGADALRVSILWAAAPQRPIEWTPQILHRGRAFLGRVFYVYRVCADAAASTSHDGSRDRSTTQAAATLAKAATHHFLRIAQFIEQYRPNAAIDELDQHFRRIKDFAVHRVETTRLQPADAEILHRLLSASATVLSPFAPYHAEEAMAMIGQPPFAALGHWPGLKTERTLGPRT